jgi:hypothetical protein
MWRSTTPRRGASISSLAFGDERSFSGHAPLIQTVNEKLSVLAEAREIMSG